MNCLNVYMNLWFVTTDISNNIANSTGVQHVFSQAAANVIMY